MTQQPLALVVVVGSQPQPAMRDAGPRCSSLLSRRKCEKKARKSASPEYHAFQKPRECPWRHCMYLNDLQCNVINVTLQINMLRKEAEREGVRREDAAHESRSRARRRSGSPIYLRGLYSLERWTAFGVPFAVASPAESPTVKTMAKHRDALEAALGTPVAFALEGATAYRVGRMLEAGLPFIAPDKQVYLPFLGIAAEQRKQPRARQAADGRWHVLAPGAAPRAHGVYGDLDWRPASPRRRASSARRR